MKEIRTIRKKYNTVKIPEASAVCPPAALSGKKKSKGGGSLFAEIAAGGVVLAAMFFAVIAGQGIIRKQTGVLPGESTFTNEKTVKTGIKYIVEKKADDESIVATYAFYENGGYVLFSSDDLVSVGINLQCGKWDQTGNVLTLTSDKTEEKYQFSETEKGLILSESFCEKIAYGEIKKGDILTYYDGDLGLHWINYAPTFAGADQEHVDDFINALKDNNVYNLLDGTVSNDYITFSDGSASLYNITPAAIRTATPDLELFFSENGMILLRHKNEIISLEYPRYYRMFLWDYDEDGTDDLVMLSISGSGILRHHVSVLNLRTKISYFLYAEELLSSPLLMDYDGKNVFIRGQKLTYSDGMFSCGDFILVPRLDDDCIVQYVDDQTGDEEIVEPFDMSGYQPDYESSSKLHVDEFLEAFNRSIPKDIYQFIRKPEWLFNATPEKIADDDSGIEFFITRDGADFFVKYGDRVFPLSSYSKYLDLGGQFKYIFLWDYDGNGVKDLILLVTYKTDNLLWEILLQDLTDIYNFRTLYSGSYDLPSESLSTDGENVYVFGHKLIYSDGKIE